MYSPLIIAIKISPFYEGGVKKYFCELFAFPKILNSPEPLSKLLFDCATILKDQNLIDGLCSY